MRGPSRRNPTARRTSRPATPPLGQRLGPCPCRPVLTRLPGHAHASCAHPKTATPPHRRPTVSFEDGYDHQLIGRAGSWPQLQILKLYKVRGDVSGVRSPLRQRTTWNSGRAKIELKQTYHHGSGRETKNLRTSANWEAGRRPIMTCTTGSRVRCSINVLIDVIYEKILLMT
jgi:hypothetical protein